VDERHAEPWAKGTFTSWREPSHLHSPQYV
jgi:hypothetical protein